MREFSLMVQIEIRARFKVVGQACRSPAEDHHSFPVSQIQNGAVDQTVDRLAVEIARCWIE
jgi:hypothetical protein